jgi:hypothetical protein
MKKLYRLYLALALVALLVTLFAVVLDHQVTRAYARSLAA